MQTNTSKYSGHNGGVNFEIQQQDFEKIEFEDRPKWHQQLDIFMDFQNLIYIQKRLLLAPLDLPK